GTGHTAERGQYVVDRRMLIASSLLGRQLDRMGQRWQREPALYGCAAADGPMGAPGSPGGTSRGRGACPQRHGLHPLWRARHLGLRGKVMSLAATWGRQPCW